MAAGGDTAGRSAAESDLKSSQEALVKAHHQISSGAKTIAQLRVQVTNAKATVVGLCKLNAVGPIA
jgi:hypothetical protein